MNIACIFPGQGSQSLGMLRELAKQYPTVKQTFDEASDVLEMDCWSLAMEGPEQELNRTSNTQPILLTAGVAVWRVWCANGGCQPSVMAGHSFGEYTALVCSESLEFSDGLLLARQRGQLMQSAVPEGQGAMAAVLGLDDAQVIQFCKQAADDQVVAAVNFNSPGQVVIAGNTEAVDRAMGLATEAGARKVMRLAVSVPAHCSLMHPAADKLADSLAATRFKRPRVDILHNVDVKTHAEAGEIKDVLARQLYSPVRWTETIRAMLQREVSVVLEMGPGKVLTALNRRIDRSLKGLSVQDPQGLNKALDFCKEVA